jgi:hypothetical protein
MSFDYWNFACNLSRTEARKCREQAERRILAILGSKDSREKRETLNAYLSEMEQLQEQLDALPVAEQSEKDGTIS